MTISNIAPNEVTPNLIEQEPFDYKWLEWLGVFKTPNELLTDSSPTLSLVPVAGLGVRLGVGYQFSKLLTLRKPFIH